MARKNNRFQNGNYEQRSLPERGPVESLVYWRDVQKSGVVFGAGLALLLAISLFSVISVIAYASLIVLLGTVSFRAYKVVLQTIQKTSDGHPFKDYLEAELILPEEKVTQAATVSVAHVNAFLAELRRLFLVEDFVDSAKFGLLLWVLTYLGSWFNGITLAVIVYVALFTLPKVYENNQELIDANLELVKTKLNEVLSKVRAAVPLGKKEESPKDK